MDEHRQLSIIIVIPKCGNQIFLLSGPSFFFQLDPFGSDQIHQTLDEPLIRMLLFCCLLAEPRSLSQLCQELFRSRPTLSQLCQELSQSRPALRQLCQELSQSRPALSQLCQELSQSRPTLSQLCQELSQSRPALSGVVPE